MRQNKDGFYSFWVSCCYFLVCFILNEKLIALLDGLTVSFEEKLPAFNIQPYSGLG